MLDHLEVAPVWLSLLVYREATSARVLRHLPPGLHPGLSVATFAIRGYRWWSIWVASCFQLSHQGHGDFIFVFANGPPYP
jgi:hypothetical protein